MMLAGNAVGAAASAVAASAAAATSATFATTTADKTKICTSSLIFRANKWCFLWLHPTKKKINCHREVPCADKFIRIDIINPQYT